MKEIQLEPGKKYRGTAWLNKYGEVHFRPEQKGTKPQNMHVVLEHENFSLYESKEIFKVTIKFAKANFNIMDATKRFSFILGQLVSYMK